MFHGVNSMMMLQLLVMFAHAAASTLLDPPSDHLNWTNSLGGPIVDRSDPVSLWKSSLPPAGSPTSAALAAMHPSAATTSSFTYQMTPGFLTAGDDIEQVQVTSIQQALDACSRLIMCRALTYIADGPNGTITQSTKVFLKSATGRGGGEPWFTWYKAAPVDPPSTVFNSTDAHVTLALRSNTATVQW